METRLLTVRGSIRRMRSTAAAASGTVRWSVLLLASREMALTQAGLGQGGGVRHGLSLCHDNHAFGVGAHP